MRILNVMTNNAELQVRGRILKAACLLVLFGILLDFPLILADPNIPAELPWIIGVIFLTFSAIFAVAHFGYVRTAGILFSLAVLGAVLTSASPVEVAERSVGAGVMIGVLMAGLIAGSSASLIFGAISIAAIALVTLLNGVPWSVWTFGTVIIILISSVLLWLLIRTLEHIQQELRHKAEGVSRAHAELAAQQQETLKVNEELRAYNEQLQQLLSLVQELETPMIPLLDRVFVVPIVGHLDTRRFGHIREVVLKRIHEKRVKTVIIDVTGLTAIDTGLVQQFDQLGSAIGLLGTEVLMTGINADMAATIIGLGINFHSIKVVGRLQDGVAQVLTRSLYQPN